MKKVSLTLTSIVVAAFFMTGADFRTVAPSPPVAEKKSCIGYTIIEAGVAVDCSGDTVKLVKKWGYYEPASRYQQSRIADSAK